MNTTGSVGHDVAIVSKRTTQKVVPCKRRKVKSGYTKHKTKWDA